MAITDQEAWTDRPGGVGVDMPAFLRETVEEIAFQARGSEFIDQTSGVSTRMTIAAMENLVSQVERRCLSQKQKSVVPRMCDLSAAIPAMTGKLELVYEGEQEGEVKVAEALIGRAVKEVFVNYFPAVYGEDDERGAYYQEVLAWFEEGKTVEISDTMDDRAYYGALNGVDGLRKLAGRHVRTENRAELSVAMEFLLEGLHQHSRISKNVADGRRSYSDMMGSLFEQ
jgi:magnesium chelatase subunit I